MPSDDEILEGIYRSLAAARIAKRRGGHYKCMLKAIGWILVCYLECKAQVPENLYLRVYTNGGWQNAINPMYRHINKQFDRAFRHYQHIFISGENYRMGGH